MCATSVKTTLQAATVSSALRVPMATPRIHSLAVDRVNATAIKSIDPTFASSQRDIASARTIPKVTIATSARKGFTVILAMVAFVTTNATGDSASPTSPSAPSEAVAAATPTASTVSLTSPEALEEEPLTNPLTACGFSQFTTPSSRLRQRYDDSPFLG